jgi:hypothetical protein
LKTNTIDGGYIQAPKIQGKNPVPFSEILGRGGKSRGRLCRVFQLLK